MGESAATVSNGGTTEPLTAEEKHLLLRFARATLEAHVRDLPLPTIDDEALSEHLRERRAVFVTLRHDGNLRGCVGYPVHRVGLARAVQENAINAASRDPRFFAVDASELPHISIEISVLSRGSKSDRPFMHLDDPTSIVIGRDGLFLEHAAGHTGLLLPQVPIEQHWGVTDFLEGICRKAGLAADAWRDPQTTLYRFTAEVFSQEAPAMA